MLRQAVLRQVLVAWCSRVVLNATLAEGRALHRWRSAQTKDTSLQHVGTALQSVDTWRAECEQRKLQNAKDKFRLEEAHKMNEELRRGMEGLEALLNESKEGYKKIKLEMSSLNQVSQQWQASLGEAREQNQQLMEKNRRIPGLDQP